MVTASVVLVRPYWALIWAFVWYIIQKTQFDPRALYGFWPLVMCAVWSPKGEERNLFVLFAVGLIGGEICRSFLKASRTIRANFWRCTSVGFSTVFFSVALALAIGIGGWWADTLHRDVRWGNVEEFFISRRGYLVSAVFQWFLVVRFFDPRLSSLLGQKRALILTPLLFAVAHLPNWKLAVLTLLFGFVGLVIARSLNSIVAVSFAHALLGLTLLFCTNWLCLHVGLSYLTHNCEPYVQKSPMDSPPKLRPWPNLKAN